MIRGRKRSARGVAGIVLGAGITVAMVMAATSAMAAGRCGKYKMDGTGNCLTPQFYKCTRDWAKCSKACKQDAKCQEKCDDKYTPQCGD